MSGPGAERTLRGKGALVTGAASGIGRGVAARLAADGARVVLADLDDAGAEAAAAELRAVGHAALGVAVDAACEASVAAMVERAAASAGGLCAAEAKAGIMVEGGILSLSLADWERAMRVNATGAFLTARAVLPHLLASGAGALVCTASTVGLAGFRGVAAYSASKDAVIAPARQLAADVADRGVRVNAVAPEAVRTKLSWAQFRAPSPDEAGFEAQLARVIARYPIARWGEVAEVAEAVLFLASPRSSRITGQVIAVDGGLLEIRQRRRRRPDPGEGRT